MANSFTDIIFTPSVKAAQSLYGSREANRDFELSENAKNELTEYEIKFIAKRDSFYQATVSESGWPYVQHRGGSIGFLKVIDKRTIGFADFRGNVQYLSVGNLNANDRISLILIDYPNRRRLKIWGRARIVHKKEHPELIAQLTVPTYRARVERGIVIQVEAYDWNCPQHITPRYSKVEIEKMIAPLLEENHRLKSQSAPLANSLPIVQGKGSLEVVISGIRQLTPRIRAFELKHPDDKELPKIDAGAHILVPIRLGDGQISVQHYSICSNPARRDAYEIAVLREENGSGNSVAAHEQFQIGLHLRCSLPQNTFKLHTDSRPAILIAGGIGIAPIKAMAYTLKAQGRYFLIHYAARSTKEAAYLDKLVNEFGDRLTFYPADQNKHMDVNALLTFAPPDAVFYVCGSKRMIDAVTDATKMLLIGSDSIRIERFFAKKKRAG
ncbi:MAG: pyridoxamine 5'-phosphate oxidase family protein [Methylococcaceae bacterium]|nr:pyridoxamine 5'-phosphate oxidase family protein [Methylococcaceae bacterium]